MKKSNLKAISFFLLIAMVVSLLSVNIFAEPITYDISENGDSSLTAVLDTTAYTLTISGSGKMKNYSNSSSVPWYSNRNYIKEVVFEEGCAIESISDYAFYECSALTGIEIPTTVTSIGKLAFYKNSKLSNFVLNSDNITFYSDTFGTNYASQNMGSGVSSGKTATVPAKQVYIIDTLTAFGYEVSTTGDAPTEEEKWNSYPTDAVFEIGAENSSDVKAYVNKHTGIANIIGTGAIKDYTNSSGSSTPLSNIVSSITDITIGEGITRVGNYAFYYYNSYNALTKLEKLSLPSTLESIGNMAFYNAGNGTGNLVFPKSLKTIGTDSFKNSDFINVSFEEGSNLETIGSSAFYESTLNSIDLPIGLKTIGESAFERTQKLTSIVLPEGLETIGESAFYGSYLKKIEIPTTVKSIGQYAFRNAVYINDITIKATDYDFDIFTFGDGTYAMGKSASNKVASVPASEVYTVEALTALGYTVSTIGTAIEDDKWNSYPSNSTFEMGKENPSDIIAYLNVYSGELVLKGIGATADYSTSTHTPIGNSNFTFVRDVIVEEGITRLGNYSLYYSSLNNYNLSLAETISLPSTLKSIGNHALRQSGMSEVVIPASVEFIGSDAFYESGITTLTFEEGSNLNSIGSNAFYGTTKLTSAILPEGLTSIGESAFNRSYVRTVEIPSTVTFIGENAFSSAIYVKDITIKATDFEYTSDIFGPSSGYWMGKSTSNKTATVPASEVFLVDKLTELGYIVSTTGREATEEDIFASYPADAVYEIGAESPNNIVAYLNTAKGTLDIIGSGATKDFSNSVPFGSNISSIKKVTISEGITYLGNHLFYQTSPAYGLSSVETLSLPTTLEGIGTHVFGKLNADTLVIPEGVTSIGTYAFYESKINNLVLPSTLTSIGRMAFYDMTSKTITNLSTETQTIGDGAFDTTNHVYLYSTNTAMLTEAADMTTEENIHFLDEPATSGVLDNGIKWTYDTETGIITFDTSEATGTELPSYSAGSQPWYGASYAYGGVLGYDFGGVSSFGSGALGGLLYGSSSLTVYGSSDLSSAVGSALGSGYSVSYGGSSSTGGSTGGDIGGGSTGDDESQDPSTDTSETGIWIYVNDEEVDFPDVQPRVWFGEVYAPLRFINQDLGATVLWDNDTRTATIQRTTDSGKKVEIKLTVGSSSMVVNGKEFTSDEIGMDATVLIEDGRLLLPGRAIVKAWDDVYFKKVYTATAYRDYYYYEDDGLGEEKLEDIEEIENFTETEVIITPDNEQEVLSNYGDTKILVNAESTFFYTSTPILIPIYVDKTGDATIPTDLYIENKCAWGPVVVKNIEFIKANGWEVKAFDTFDFKNTLADSKYIGLTINEVVVEENGSVDMNESLSSSILYKSKKQLTFDAKIPAQRSALKEICAGIIFTVDFDKVVE